MGQNQVTEVKEKLKQAVLSNNEDMLSQIQSLIRNLEGQNKIQSLQHALKTVNKNEQITSQNPSKDQIKYQKQPQQKKTNKNIDLFQIEILFLSKVEQKICETIIEVMSTKKLYHIRQNFRKLALSILNLQNIELYLFHDSGRIQFHDFRQNYITQILECNEKRKFLQIALANTSAAIQNVDMLTCAVFRKLFSAQVANSEQQYHYCGQINKINEKYSILVQYTSVHSEQLGPINEKIIQKIVKISMIQIEEQTQYNIIQLYSKQLLDILGVIVNQSQEKIKKSLKQKDAESKKSHKSLIQLMKSLSKIQNNQNIIVQSLKYQQFRFQLLQRVRMYSKYVCEENIVFMDFDETGTLSFLANNRNDSDLNALLAKLVLTDDLCIEKVFYDDVNLQKHIKSVMGGLSKNKKMYDISSGKKVRAVRSQQNQILRIQILIEDPSTISQGSCSSSTLGGISSHNKKSSNSDSLSLGKKNKSSNSLINSIKKQNPGIMEDGWLNLFIKDHEVKRKSNLMVKKKRTLFAKSQEMQNYTASQKNLEADEIQLLQQIDVYSPDTNLLLLEDAHLQPFVKKVFSEMKFFKNLQFNKDYFDNFLFDLHQGYQIHNNSFHNFTHGVNVMHTCFIICSIQKNDDILTPLKFFSTVLSGLCHDVGHTGRTNSFQIASKSKKALTYNDLSPLQNFHASLTFQILRRPENNFLQKIAVEQFNQIRKDIISNILYTDIKQHFPLIKKFKAIEHNSDQAKPISDENLRVLTGMITHTSDFGGSAKEFQICRQWSRKVNIEFSAQYRQQAQIGVPQTPFLKDLENESIMAKNQMGFLKVIVFPLYEVLNQFYQEQSSVKKLKIYAQENIKCWQKVYSGSLVQAKETQNKN